jgi:hypothetical protein
MSGVGGRRGGDGSGGCSDVWSWYDNFKYIWLNNANNFQSFQTLRRFYTRPAR